MLLQIPNLSFMTPKGALGEAAPPVQSKHHSVWSSCKMAKWVKAPKWGLQCVLQQHIKDACKKKKKSLTYSILQTYFPLVRSVLSEKNKITLKWWWDRISDNGELNPLIIKLIYLFTLEKKKSQIRRKSIKRIQGFSCHLPHWVSNQKVPLWTWH